MKMFIDSEELITRINLNFNRLHDSYYDIDHVFDGDDVDWPGDKEGRALLAFVSHYKINSSKVPCMDMMIDKIPQATLGKFFFGKPTGNIIFEQQLSGHSWYLRGLCEYYEQFGDERALEYLNKTVENIYIPTKGRYSSYPVDRNGNTMGAVSGHSTDTMKNWKLSTDIGCAFMSIDGLSHYYKITKNEDVKELLSEMSDVFDKIDKYALHAQTHCTLTAARGFIRMYEETGDTEYFERAKRIFDLYIDKGMTYTYQNFNWFGKGDTWTEPCAIVDSLMLAVMLYKITGDDVYRMYAARIYFNGFATLQRPNGGAGTDTTVSKETRRILRTDLYEAHFCCTMRLAEGLCFINQNRDLIYANTDGKVSKDGCNRYADGDIIYCEIVSDEEPYSKYVESLVFVDGHKLVPIIKLYKLDGDEKMCHELQQKIIFDE